MTGGETRRDKPNGGKEMTSNKLIGREETKRSTSSGGEAMASGKSGGGEAATSDTSSGGQETKQAKSRGGVATSTGTQDSGEAIGQDGPSDGEATASSTSGGGEEGGQEANAGSTGGTMHGVTLRVHSTVVEDVMRWSKAAPVDTGCSGVSLTEGSGMNKYRLVRIRAVARESCWCAMERLQRAHVEALARRGGSRGEMVENMGGLRHERRGGVWVEGERRVEVMVESEEGWLVSLGSI